jgi:uncharacterized protein YdhG (YjbR/CyaY superfamily)
MAASGDPKAARERAAAAEATKTIDATLAALPPGQRSALQSLRAMIAAAAPAAVEAISYGTPAFRYRGRPLVSYGAAKAHCSFFPMSPAVIEAHRALLTGFDTAKGTIRFTPERQIPEGVVTTLVRARLAELDAR